MLISDLKTVRRSQGLSREALAAKIGVDPQAIKRLEAGIGSMQNLIMVMRALDYHLSALARGAELPSQLKQRRENLRLPLTEAARRAGISRATVLSLERGRGSVRSLIQLLDAIAPRARRREPPRAHWTPDPLGDRDHRFTPPEFLSAIYEAFGDIDFDPCGHELSPVQAKRILLLDNGEDGLRDDWSGELCYLNPPYSAMLRWLKRADVQWHGRLVSTIVALVPARTDSAWFHDHLKDVADIYMLKGRLRFLTDNGKGHQAPFPLMVVMWGTTGHQRARFTKLVPGFWL